MNVKRLYIHVLWIFFFWVLGLLVFRSVVLNQNILMTTDDNIGAVSAVHKILPEGFSAAWFDEPVLGFGVGSITAAWSNLFNYVLSPKTFTNWMHLIDLFLASVFLFLFLRREGLHPAACAMAAVVAYWLGSNLTLTYAGHTKKFGILFLSAAALYAVSFMRNRRLLIPSGIFAALVGMMFCEQQDVAIFFALPLGGYFLLALQRSGASWPVRLTVIGVTAGLALMVASPALLSGFKTAVEGVSAVQESDQQKWDFATQWSWPPEESIAFIAPGYTGWRSGEPDGPYWGRMGRTPGWEQHRQGFMNFKLENTYLGIIPVFLALFSMFWLYRPKAKPDVDDPVANNARPEIIYWMAVCVVALLLAFGKYFPLYALFYQFPVVNNIRNPNKFLQVFQLALAILSAWGLHGLIVRDKKENARWAVKAVLGVLGAFAFVVLIGLLARAGGGDAAALARFGWPEAAAAAISATKTMAIGHMLVMLLILLAILSICLRRPVKTTFRAGLAVLMVLLVSLDGLWLSRHYITTMPESWIAANPVTETLQRELGENRVATLQQDGFYNLWLTYLLPYQGIRAFNFTQMPRMPEDYKKLLTAFQRDPIRLWQMSGVGGVLLPAEAFAQITAQDIWKQLLHRRLAFDVHATPDNGIRTVASDTGHHVLAFFAPEKAGRFRLIGGTHRFGSADAALAWMADPRQPVFDQVAVHDMVAPDLEGSGAAGTVQVSKISTSVIELDVEATATAVLRCADRYDADWTATIDGNPVPVFRADFCMMGVLVSPGHHAIRLEYRPSKILLYVQLVGYILFSGLLLMGLARLSFRFLSGFRLNSSRVVGSALLGALLMTGGGCRKALPAPTLSYRQLLEQMADTHRIADLEQPGSVLFSSWDRSGGNDDYGHFLKDGPKGWKVLAEVKGSGYISRFWCTGAKNGQKRIRLYVDDDRMPIIETTLDEWFGRAGFQDHLPMRGYEPYCWFSWLPVSFSRSLTVMQEAPVGDEKLYYQININLLREGEIAESWRPAFRDDPANQRLVDALTAAWSKAQSTETDGMGAAVTIPPGVEQTVWTGESANIIQSFRASLLTPEALSVAEREARLRALVVNMYWDGSEAPSVSVPLGALGGSMWREIQYGSVYFGMSGGVFRVSFPMPYRRGARIALKNESAADASVSVDVKTEGQAPGMSLGYFHANWRKSTADNVGRPHVVAQISGDGKYIGCQMGVRSLDRSWWALESDELIYKDGELDASWKGTGLEDYFNGGWYYGNPLASPFHGIIFKAMARAQQYRLHPFDPISFSTQLRVEFERGPGQVSRAELESVAYYYLRRPQAADSELRDPIYRKPVDDPVAMYTVMTEVVNMERLGDPAAAIHTIRDYLARYPGNPFQEMLERRIKHYDQPPVIAKGKGILGLYANSSARIYLDGQPLMASNDAKAERVYFREINLPPGEHTIAVQVAHHPYPDWVQVMLEYPGGFLGTDNTWKYTFNPPGTDWSRAGFDDSKWLLHGNIWVKGPPEEPYIWCEPNDRPWTQSRAWGIHPMSEWPPERGVVVYRKPFTVENHD